MSRMCDEILVHSRAEDFIEHAGLMLEAQSPFVQHTTRVITRRVRCCFPCGRASWDYDDPQVVSLDNNHMHSFVLFGTLNPSFKVDRQSIALHYSAYDSKHQKAPLMTSIHLRICHLTRRRHVKICSLMSLIS
jgi:hypothetical protein